MRSFECNLIIVMGVSGSGKSTIAKALSQRLAYTFVEADDFHSERNVAHMRSGKPLTDAMREPWLQSLEGKLKYFSEKNENCVLSFSGLRAAHRARLRLLPFNLLTLYLHGSKESIRQRLLLRKGHFMPNTLLDSQFDAMQDPLAEPATIKINIDESKKHSIEQSIAAVKKHCF